MASCKGPEKPARAKDLAYQALSVPDKVEPNDAARPLGLSPYCRRTRVPLMLWLLRVLRKLGISRSINSKYDDSAGVLWLAL